MTAHKIAAFIALLLLVLAALLCIIGTGTLHWLDAKVDIAHPLPIPSPELPEMTITLKVELNAYIGLRKICNDMAIDFKNATNDMRQLLSMGLALPHEETMCLTKDDMTDGHNMELMHSMRHFKHILICMVVGLLLLLGAVIVSLIKSPCVKIKVKKTLLVFTFLLAVGAVIAILTGILIARNELNGEADFIHIGIEANMGKLPLIPGGPSEGSKVISTSAVATSNEAVTTSKRTSSNRLLSGGGIATVASATAQSSLSDGSTAYSVADIAATTIAGETNPNNAIATYSTTLVTAIVNTTGSTIQSNLVTNTLPTIARTIDAPRSPKTTESVATLTTEPSEDGGNLEEFLIKVVQNQIKDSMVKGYSYELVCAGLVFMLLAILVTILEYYFAKKSGESDYERELLKSDGYDMPSKAAPETA